MEKILAVIPARQNSQGLAGKNIYPVLGHPLLAWTIAAATLSNVFDRIIVSSDSDIIGEVGKSYGAEYYRRPDHLATSSASPKDAVLNLMKELAGQGYIPDRIVLLQPTSPLRLADDIRGCIELHETGRHDTAASFSPAHPNPLRAFHIEDNRAVPVFSDDDVWKRRQEFTPQFHLNGAVYVVRTSEFMTNEDPGFVYGNLGAFIMPIERSIDVDTKYDLAMAAALMQDYVPPSTP